VELLKEHPSFCGFRTDAGREAAHEKANALLAKGVKGKRVDWPGDKTICLNELRPLRPL
jgi:hypothetical protein